MSPLKLMGWRWKRVIMMLMGLCMMLMVMLVVYAGWLQFCKFANNLHPSLDNEAVTIITDQA